MPVLKLFVEYKREDDRNNLESLLYKYGYAFYDATHVGIKYISLEAAEMDLEQK